MYKSLHKQHSSDGDAELMTIINFKILHLALAAFALDFNNMHLVAFSHV